jgi:NAD(P)-dependent dehydrogenase (short-subunit alcohol dehydrogenase family)
VPSGQGPAPRLPDITNALFWDDVNVKVLGYVRCAREVAPYMQRQGWGRIISIGGLAARQSGSLVSSMRNAAIVALTKNLADELGPYGINVTAVHPSTTRTEKTPGVLGDQARQQGVSVEEAERRMAQGNSLRRIIDARDIAAVVTFLASPRAVAVNGDVIAAGGGVGRGIYY